MQPDLVLQLQQLTQNLKKKINNDEIKQIIENRFGKDQDQKNYHDFFGYYLNKKKQIMDQYDECKLSELIQTRLKLKTITSCLISLISTRRPSLTRNSSSTESGYQNRSNVMLIIELVIFEIKKEKQVDDRSNQQIENNANRFKLVLYPIQQYYMPYYFYSFNSISQVQINQQLLEIYKTHIKQSHQNIQIINKMTIKKNDTKIYARHKQVYQKVLVLGLEDTLVHFVEGHTYQRKLYLGQNYEDQKEIKINVRPGLRKFLRQMSVIYQLIVFSEKEKEVVDIVLDYLDPNKDLVSLRLSRDHCLHHSQQDIFGKTVVDVLIKDLRILGNIQLDDVFVVNTDILQIGYNLEQAIPIIPFQNYQEDSELDQLADILKIIYKDHFQETSQEILKKHFHITRLYINIYDE